MSLFRRRRERAAYFRLETAHADEDEADEQVLAQLRDLHVDVAAPLPVEHVTRVDSEEAALRLGDELIDRGFDVLIGRPAGGAAWRNVVAEHEMVVTLASLRASQAQVGSALDVVAGEYVAWQAKVPEP